MYRDHKRLIRQCDEEKIVTFGVTTTPKAFERNAEMAIGFPFAIVGLGLHPQLVAERAGELPLFEKLLARTRYVGEIGLDAGPRFYASFQEQRRIFERILGACNEQGGKVLSIHSVRSVSKVLRELEANLQNRTCVPVLHWFTGTRSEAARAIELGCYFSINIEMLRTPKMHALLRTLPTDRLLTESDGPFVTHDERPIRPTDMPATVQRLAELRATESTLLGDQILENLRRLTIERPEPKPRPQLRLFKS
ncbi:Qat anti-phage system TatD family nuclease QatD [Lysobacter yangpyeongensis]|uniref:Qat anti-phage system TatD family nuclease QatD n=1 Tax=Lysobacter yangpyeongensis TaxID=346182 RepID=A0ABW0SK12_9GAMM